MYKKMLQNALAYGLNKLNPKEIQENLTEKEKNSVDNAWFKAYSARGTYADNLYDVIARANKLPVVPQKYNGDVKTTLEEKCNDRTYLKYYNAVKAISSSPKETTKITTGLFGANLELHEKMLTAYYVASNFRQLDMDTVLIAMTTAEEKKSIFYSWYDCCARESKDCEVKMLEKFLVKIISKYNGITDKDTLLTKYESKYKKVLDGKLRRGMR